MNQRWNPCPLSHHSTFPLFHYSPIPPFHYSLFRLATLVESFVTISRSFRNSNRPRKRSWENTFGARRNRVLRIYPTARHRRALRSNISGLLPLTKAQNSSGKLTSKACPIRARQASPVFNRPQRFQSICAKELPNCRLYHFMWSGVMRWGDIRCCTTAFGVLPIL